MLVGKSQQMILVLLPVGSRLHDRVVGKVFQIQPDFTFQQPHERIHPTDDIHYLTGNDINGMELTCMSQFMCQDFLSLIFFQLRKIDKNPMPEWERIVRIRKVFYPNSIYCFFLTYQREPEDAEQLDDEPGGEQRYSDKIYPCKQGH